MKCRCVTAWCRSRTTSFIVILAALAAPVEAAAQPAPARGGDDELQLVVALFRHGVRAPLEGFAEKANLHSGSAWPTIEEWGAGRWGELTRRGQLLASALGEYHAAWYRGKAWRDGYEVLLWADTDQRTRATADALASGFRKEGIGNVKVASLEGGADPLFHPFRAQCGVPDRNQLDAISKRIDANVRSWIRSRYRVEFNSLYGALGCAGAAARLQQCTPLNTVSDSVKPCGNTGACPSPIEWQGQFSYASSASEAFILEYANGAPMDGVGWGRARPPTLQSMLGLHEFYFDQMDREPYIAKIQGSNLVREVLQTLERKASRGIDGCPHAGGESFVGLVGHDTDLASVGALLGLVWKFDDPRLPADTVGLPDNDALPAGALVFELRRRAGAYFVRIEYVTLALQQMRLYPNHRGDASRLAVQCRVQSGGNLAPCGDIPLDRFSRLANGAIGTEFLSRCSAQGRQVCQ